MCLIKKKQSIKAAKNTIQVMYGVNSSAGSNKPLTNLMHHYLLTEEAPYLCQI